MHSRVLLLFGKMPQRNLHVNWDVKGTTFQSGLRFLTGLSSLQVSCKRAPREMDMDARQSVKLSYLGNSSQFCLFPK